jgi:hypothetical protein
MKKSKNTANLMKITKRESRKKTTSEIKTKATIFILKEIFHLNQYNSQYNERTFERGSFNARGRGGRGRGRTPLRPKDMYCIIHGKGAGHTSKMCPKVKKSIEETHEENKISSQSKAVNHMIQGQQNSYYPIQFGHSQAMILGLSPSYSYGPVAIYDPNQWRQNQQ